MTNDLIECVRREIRLRNGTYPHLVKAGKLTDAEAASELQKMARVLAVIQTVRNLTIDARDLVHLVQDMDDVRAIRDSATLERLVQDLKAMPEFAQVEPRQPAIEHPQVVEALARIRAAQDRHELTSIVRAYDHITDPRLRCQINGASAAWHARNTTRSPA